MKRWELISYMLEYIEETLFLIPHLLVNTKHASICGIPPGVENNDGRVLLNVGKKATNSSLRVGMYQIEFDCMFGGEPTTVAFAPEAVEIVMANGGQPHLSLGIAPVEKAEKKPKLRVV